MIFTSKVESELNVRDNRNLMFRSSRSSLAMAGVKYAVRCNTDAWWRGNFARAAPISMGDMTSELTTAADSPTSPSKGGIKGDSKICGVCNDKALGYNFNAITCESCKAFFRRNALKKKEFKCPFSDNCKVDVVTRRFCQKCRLKKCFDIGMKKEWIMTDEEKKIKKQKIEENRQKRHADGHPKQQHSPSSVASEESFKSSSSLPQSMTSPATSELLPTTPPDSSTPLTTNEDRFPLAKVRRTSDEHTDVHCPTPQSEISEYDCVQSPCSSIASKDAFSPPQLMTSQVSPAVIPSSPQSISHSSLSSPEGRVMVSCNNDDCSDSCKCGSQSQTHSGFRETMSSVLNVAIKTEYNDLMKSNSLDSPPSSLMPTSSLRDLSQLECAKLNELVVANRAMKSPVHHDPRVMGTTDPSLLNVINMTDIAIRRLIKMSKKINGFKNLCQEDQIALLKGGCTELMILRSVMTYDPEKECWQGPKAFCIKLDVLREAKGNIYEEHKRFIQSFEPAWRTDENIMLLLSAITLFNPVRPNIIHADVIKLEQEAYYCLLRQYLESLYVGCESRSVYIKLIQKMEELHSLNENHVRLFLDLNPKDVEPLLIEIFDLKNH